MINANKIVITELAHDGGYVVNVPHCSRARAFFAGAGEKERMLAEAMAFADGINFGREIARAELGTLLIDYKDVSDD